MSRVILVGLLFLTACFGVGGTFVKELASTHVYDTGLGKDDMAVIDRGATRHGCAIAKPATACNDRGCIVTNRYECPELPKDHLLGCRAEGDVLRCAVTADKAVGERLVNEIVAAGRAP